jgi:plasmid stability protein
VQVAPIDFLDATCHHGFMDDAKRYPSQTAERFQIRMPDGLRDRIRMAAERNNRSMNAEILNALESKFPAPIALEDTVADIQQAIKLFRKFKGKILLEGLADDLDYLIRDISRSADATEEVRDSANEYLDNNAKFVRVTPPKVSD